MVANQIVGALGIIPARGGSKGIPRKNLAALGGRPLIGYTIEAAFAARRLERVVVSTDDDEIAAVSEALGCEVVRRPPALAEDDTPTLPVLQHAAAAAERDGLFRAEPIVTLQPTSPLRTGAQIDEALELFAADPDADSLVSCVEVPHVFHPRSVMREDPNGYLVPYLDAPQPTRRQAKEVVYARNGAAIYITRRACLERFVFGGRLLRYPMDPRDSVDIDEPGDLERAARALAERGTRGPRR